MKIPSTYNALTTKTALDIQQSKLPSLPETSEEKNIVLMSAFRLTRILEKTISEDRGVKKPRKIEIKLTDTEYSRYNASALVQNTSIEAEITDYLAKRFPL